jgi:hypothetical protein
VEEGEKEIMVRKCQSNGRPGGRKYVNMLKSEEGSGREMIGWT